MTNENASQSDASQSSASESDASQSDAGHDKVKTLLNHVPSNGVATGKKMFEPAVTSVFANVNLPLFVYFSSSSKLKYFF